MTVLIMYFLGGGWAPAVDLTDHFLQHCVLSTEKDLRTSMPLSTVRKELQKRTTPTYDPRLDTLQSTLPSLDGETFLLEVGNDHYRFYSRNIPDGYM